MRRLPALAVALAIGLGLSTRMVSAAPVAIAPGTTWNDSGGKLIQAHGGGMIRVGPTYYWFGEDKTGESKANATFQNVPCYASTDLASWTFMGNVLTRQMSGELGPNRIIERPKVIYNRTTRRYVMYMHVDTPDYTTARVGVATSSSVCGSYSYRGSFRPLGQISRDEGLFQDDDGAAYLLSEDRAHGLRIDRLSADYLSVVSSVAVLADFEAPALFKFNRRYYLLGSHLTGWRTNDNEYTTSTSLSSSWSAWAPLAPVGTHTFHSQTTFVLPVAGSQGTTFVFMGDRWKPATLGRSPYIWLPLTVEGTSLSVAWHDPWFIDTATGLWHA